MKKIFTLFIIFTFLVLIPIFTVRADFGPKRTLELEIIGVNEPYFIDLLIPGLPPVPGDVWQYVYDEEGKLYAYTSDEIIPDMLPLFEEDGYISALLYRMIPTIPNQISENKYMFAYNAPSNIKILLVFDDGHYITSNVIELQMFNSKITYDLTGIDTSVTQTNVGNIEEILPVGTMISELLIRIVVTIGIEIIILFLFNYTFKKSFLLVTYVNLFTQITLTGFLFAVKYFYFPGLGEIFVLIVGEVFILTIELSIYSVFLKEHSKRRAILYTLAANLMSLLAGFGLVILMSNF